MRFGRRWQGKWMFFCQFRDAYTDTEKIKVGGIREQGIPFSLKPDIPNEVTTSAIEEGRRIASDTRIQGYRNMDDLKADLDL